MAVAVLVKTVVFDRDLYKPGHMVHKWVTLVTEHFVMHAKERAPKRTGRLANGISGETNRVGERQVEGLIASSAPYTMYVLRGTTGPIRTTKAWGGGDPYIELWGSIDPKTGKFTRRHIPGAKRKQHRFPKKGYWMPIPSHEEIGNKPFFAYEVEGQAPNNFLMGAWRATAHNHRAIRGKVPTWLRDL